MANALIVSVGGSPQPLAKSIVYHKPKFVCFLASQDTISQISKVEEIVRKEWPDANYETYMVLLDDPENIEECYPKAQQCFEEAASRGFGSDDCVAEITGGTRVMSAALALVSVERDGRVSYVGGTQRDKEGLGIVKSGYERIRQFANPWRVYATERKKLAQALFKKHRYEGAAQILRNLPTETEERERELLGAVAEVAEAYALWDRFRHKEAVEKLKRASDRLSQSSKLLGAEEPWLKDFAAQVERSLEQLQFIQQRTRNFEPGRRDPALAADLAACAERRIESDAFDDAVARLYRAIEMLGQCEFERVFNTDPSRADPERLPESLREEYRRKYRDDQDDGRLKLPLFAVFNALAKHGKTQLSQKFQESLDELKKLLHARNESVLGHGTTPVKEATASKMLEFVRSWLPDNCPLPKFARLELG